MTAIDIREHGGQFGGGVKINGNTITAEAADTIGRGDFVKLNGVMSPAYANIKSRTLLKNQVFHLDSGISIPIDNTTFLLLWFYPDRTPLYAEIVTAINGTVTVVSSTALTAGNAISIFGVSKIGTNKYLIPYADNGLEMRFKLIQVVGTTVSVLSDASTSLGKYPKNAAVCMMTSTVGILALSMGNQPMGYSDTPTRYYGLITINPDNSITISGLTANGTSSNYSQIFDFYKINDTKAMLIQDGNAYLFTYSGTLSLTSTTPGYPQYDGYLIDTIGTTRIVGCTIGIYIVETASNYSVTVTQKLSPDSFYSGNPSFQLYAGRMVYRGTGVINEGYIGYAESIIKVGRYKYIIVTRGYNTGGNDYTYYPIVAAAFGANRDLSFTSTQRVQLESTYVSSWVFALYDGSLISILWNAYDANTRHSYYTVRRNDGTFKDTAYKVKGTEAIDGIALKSATNGVIVNIITPNI
jgi:hypothetical protein